MMKCAVDLHIHSCLSPCADDDMTPCNIAGMAYVKHLDCIALTDHNAAENLPAAALAAREMGVCLLPGIEVTSSEEVHILCYFPAVDPAVDFGRMIYDHLPPLPNNKRIFGNQMILGPEDEAQGELSKLLIQATDLSIVEIGRHLRGGAHQPLVQLPARKPRLSARKTCVFRAGGLSRRARALGGHGEL